MTPTTFDTHLREENASERCISTDRVAAATSLIALDTPDEDCERVTIENVGEARWYLL